MTASAHPAHTTPAPGAGLGTLPRLSFAGILRSERIKLSSLRSVRITLLITLLASLGLSLLMAFAMRSQFTLDGAEVTAFPAEQLEMYLLTASTFASPFLALIFGVLGVFAMSSEYSSGMILSSLAAVPRRTPMYLGKGLVLAAIAGITAFTITALGVAIGVLIMPVAAGSVFSRVVITGVLGTIAYLVCVTLLGFGIAAVVRSTAGGIALIAGIIFVLPIGMQILSMTGWEWVNVTAGYLPMLLGSTLAEGLSGAPGAMGAGVGPSYSGALLAIALWAAVPVAAGLGVLNTRDAR